MDQSVSAAEPGSPNDAELVRQLAAGTHAALGPLYMRHAPYVHNLAAQALDRSAAEEIVQDVFLAVWRNAAVFDPARGTFRAWITQIAHRRVLNELRRRTRRPRDGADPNDPDLAAVPDPTPDPAELVWLDDRRGAVRSAMSELPPSQREAVGLAFFGDLTHQQVAQALHLPLGTAKTRIRAGLQRLRANLAVAVMAVLALGIVGVGVARVRALQESLARDDGALGLVTASDTAVLRLTAAAGVRPDAHANYRHRAGATIVVVTFSNLPPPSPGTTYALWARLNGAWRPIGTVEPDANGIARLIVEGPDLAADPESIELRAQPPGATGEPSGSLVLVWSPG